MTELRPTLGAIAVVLKRDSVLLVQRRNPPDAGLWGFPGGHVELGETALDAAARELSEETGVTAQPVGYLTNIDVLSRDAQGNINAHFLLAVVMCEYVSGAPVAADDVQEAAWVHFDQVRQRGLPMSNRVADVLDLALGDSEA